MFKLFSFFIENFNAVLAELKLSFSFSSTVLFAEKPSEWAPLIDKLKFHLSEEYPVLIALETVPKDPNFEEKELLIPFLLLLFVIIEITPPAADDP